jgi:signal transduction histidine kinase/integral membrane sensor domain MASE1
MSERPAAFRPVLIVPVVAAFYYAGAQIGLALTFPPATTSVLWPPNAILTAALLMVRPRLWWLCLAAALPVHILLLIDAGFSARLLGLLFVTNCSEALIAAIAVRALSDAPTRFDSFRRVATFVAGAGLLAPILSSFGDAAVVDLVRGEPYWDVWRVRVFANVLTELSVAPALIIGWDAARSLVSRRPRARSLVERIAYVAAVIGLAMLVFGRPGVRDALPGTPPTPIVLLLPVFGWGAMRFGVGGVSVALLGSAFVASYETAEGLRPFATMSPGDSLIAVQMILAVVAMPLMCLAGLLGDRRHATATLAARLRFEEVLSGIAGSFLRLTDHAVALRTSLTRVSEFFDADYVALVQFGDAATEFESENEWSGPGVMNLKAGAAWRRFPAAMAQALNGEAVVWTSADAIPNTEDQDYLSFNEFGFRFLIILPFVTGHTPHSALMLATTGDRILSESDLVQLRLIADVIATARARRRAELDAQRSRHEVAQIARRASMGELASALAHQLNQPLAGIMANAQAAQRLIRSGTPAAADVHDGLVDIVEDCRRARDVVQRVRDMVAPSNVQMAPLDLADVVREVAMLVASDTLIRRVTLSLEFGGEATPVRGDRVLLQQAVLNVIVNAIDAVAEQRVGDRVVTVWTGSSGNSHARISVRDRGAGLPPGSEAQVFEPFFSTKATGLGMGLAIARSIIESHGGTIQLDSDATGVVVTINLPVAELAA